MPTIHPDDPRLRGLLLLIFVTAVWGSTFAVVKQLGEVLPPAVLIAALALLPTALLL